MKLFKVRKIVTFIESEFGTQFTNIFYNIRKKVPYHFVTSKKEKDSETRKNIRKKRNIRILKYKLFD